MCVVSVTMCGMSVVGVCVHDNVYVSVVRVCRHWVSVCGGLCMCVHVYGGVECVCRGECCGGWGLSACVDICE